MKVYKFIIVLFLVTFIYSCGPSGKAHSETEAEAQPETELTNDSLFLIPVDTFANVTVEPIDTFHNALAQLISGMDLSYFSNEVDIDSAYWNKYHNQVGTAFSKMEERRLVPMQKWMDSISSDNINDTSLLFYPFSGADFLHAYYLFPEANDYVLMAKEKIGDIPDINSMKSDEVENYLDAVDQSLIDIYKRSYFITKRMRNDTRSGGELNGLLPLFYWFIARTDHEIINVSSVFVDSSSVLKEKSINTKLPANRIEGVKFIFRKVGSDKVKSMTYFDCDISNDGFIENPEFKKYLNAVRPGNSFVKSASYLMHYNSFSDIREMVQQKSQSILEDDTGIPYKYFDSLKWEINLYGLYVNPVKDFSQSRFQTDLNRAYTHADKYRGKLPFSLGYHWGTQKQNQMLYIKK
jgi:hypothetical protein